MAILNEEKLDINYEMECKRLTRENNYLNEEIRRLNEKCDSLNARFCNVVDECKVVKQELENSQRTIENKNLDILNLKNEIVEDNLKIAELEVYKRFYDDFHHSLMVKANA